MDVKGAFKRDKGEKKKEDTTLTKSIQTHTQGGKTLQNKKKKKQPSRFFFD